ncbi:MAG: hypothetical protein A3C93_06580 [Candidatus Lloydbacteria bacterium RIFCSPHIGHO2_02_FULL_54_17]|uniref:Uncharacterized protein n=1 Tax=Candidatus Lloydbacteria bacterium RIFCSPHIGHO2_02_FULL_54_17 TaxID=1798664 RepID=A0A1G2DC18_9BACT|nr:MAG: hypothetical protein A2762_05355 [Candidatus Lloydbacteria bacterium RIFCSPHIGHO2_01_FULL_54_11]OGZ11165.1 MAG: hypothetical protein A3C93_06580 [Candidatus Lloydbacteria bacterium RIFCSPHIGHO2_02_FULL_54_17]OGZ14980.1 MAG: hypothetical protein A2948_00840 [Candidatus Lloydbacteria bacterium RIFCSPLOWO2_01_FULL_54_18]OGZ15268.1 MAG: hypothetical protein A3H76_03250 [Candidatus Lloydbacteria bacterium RIFCSPLOWO2_02_FULL_54_12]
MGDIVTFPERGPFTEEIVRQFVKRLVDQKRLELIEHGTAKQRIEDTLAAFFHFLRQKGVAYPPDGNEAKRFAPALSVWNWEYETRQTLLNEWHRKPPPGVKMIARRTLAILAEKGFVFERKPEAAAGNDNVVSLFKRPQ